MAFTSLSQAYRIAPRVRDVTRTPLSRQAAPPASEREPQAGHEGGRRDDHPAEGDHDIDSVRRSPLLRALLRSLQVPLTTGAQDVVLEHALIAFARALNLASGDVDAAPQPMPARADEAAQRRARNEERLLVTFAELQHAAGRRGAATRDALQAQLGAFLHALARELRLDDDRAGEATQPGSLISVRA